MIMVINNSNRPTHFGTVLMSMMQLISIIFLASNNIIKSSSAISCYDCRSEDISCNVGECVGSTCVKMETSNIDNDRKTISKSCSIEFEDNQCKQSYLGLKVVLRCTCDSNFCNGDRNLVAAGLQRTDDSNNGVGRIPRKMMMTTTIAALTTTTILCQLLLLLVTTIIL